MNDLGNRIKTLRMAKKISQPMLAKRLGVTRSAVAVYENGTRTPSLDVIVKIARSFNVTVDNLLGNNSKDFIDISELSPTQRDNVQNLILTYKKINRLIVKEFILDDDDPEDDIESIEFYLLTDIDTFQELLDENKK